MKPQIGLATSMFTAISKMIPGQPDIPKLLEVLKQNGVTQSRWGYSRMNTIRRWVLLLGLVMVGFPIIQMAQAEMTFRDNQNAGFDRKQIDRGRYLVRVAGCNDCHTPGYMLSEGKVAEEAWLTGDSFGWRGPWGTTYATNLRLLVNAMSEEQWMGFARSLKARPPMPWFNLNIMQEEDLKAIYQFIRYLGLGGQVAPAYVPPDQDPHTPFALFPSPPTPIP